VEGTPAGGSAKAKAVPQDQAILPLKGKILNVEESGAFDKNAPPPPEVGTLNHRGLGCGQSAATEFQRSEQVALSQHQLS